MSESAVDAADAEAAAIEFRRTVAAIESQVSTSIVGQREAIRGVMISLVLGGHALLEGVPGIGKTSMVRAFAGALGMTHNRIQFTPDLMPADITGTVVLVDRPDQGPQLVFQPGPLFGGLILADEINRASPRTQSALLEAMQEGTVTIGQRHPSAAAAVLGARDPEPDRDAGHLSPAGGAARPLPAQAAFRLPDARRAHGGGAPHDRPDAKGCAGLRRRNAAPHGRVRPFRARRLAGARLREPSRDRAPATGGRRRERARATSASARARAAPRR